MAFFVYMLAHKRNGTLYIGMTENLEQRVAQHKNGQTPGFASKYGLKMLVCFDIADTREAAIQRERQLKKWNRAWKLGLIEDRNPEWHDLWDDFR